MLVTIILSRLLLPEEFGLIAMIMVFVGFANVFADSGLGSALVQRSEINDNHIRTALTLNVAIGLALALLLFLGSPLLTRFYGAPQLLSLSRAFSFTFLFSAVGIVPHALMRREMRFKELANIDIVTTLVSGSIAVALAFSGAGVWALIALSLMQYLSRSTLLWRSSKRAFQLGLEWQEAKELFGFSIGLLGFNSINYWARNADQLIIGKVLGATSLGLYSRAYQLMMLPISQINSILTSVMFPAMSSIQDQPKRIALAYSRSLQMIAMLAFPMTLGLWTIADPLIPLMYGSEWSSAIPAFKILCWVSLLQVLMNTCGWIFTSMGKTRLMFYWGIVSSVVVISGISVGVLFGSIESVARGYLIANALLFIPLFTVVGTMIPFSWPDVFRAVYRPFVCALVMTCAVLLIEWGIPLDWSSTLTMVAKITVGMLSYLVMVIVLRVPSYEEAHTLLGSRIGRFAKSRFWRLLAPHGSVIRN